MPQSKGWLIAKEGLPFLIGAAFFVLLFALVGWKILFILSILLALFIAFFFRNPKRKIPEARNVIVSPADGKVIEVGKCQETRYLQEETLKVSIFMSLFDVHMNRSPVSGRVFKTAYNPGKFRVAHVEKSSLLNEQNAILMMVEEQWRVLVVQIAGFLARRIISYAASGETLQRGQIFGLICFGSRVDLHLPPGVKPIVKVGQKVKGGESIIGYLP